MDLLLEGVVGSQAYGLATPDSDTDYAGIYVEPTSSLLGLHPPSRERATIKGRGGADATYHEVGKALHLGLSCNPTAMELLWLADYLHFDPFGEELIGLRHCLLSAPRVRDAFLGYATSQFRRLLERGKFPDVPDKRREKHARHTMRLLHQGLTLYTTGVLPIRVEDPDRYFDFGRAIMADPHASAAQTLIRDYGRRFDEATTVLPDQPDEAPLEDLLQRIRRAHLDREPELQHAS
ncbi:DNA polymerase beta superfamily protein [Nocardia asteroides]|uniref:nucleotidyltransferase domain-containing protein n=1 Tax=Nocardia asteroides TaxID=1824 RepID=UPI0037CAD4E5